MSDAADKHRFLLTRIKRCVHKNREILITLRDRSTVMGRAPVIVGYEEIQFCSIETRMAVVLPLDNISTVEPPSLGRRELDEALERIECAIHQPNDECSMVLTRFSGPNAGRA
jgi:hypothetical protein